MRPKDGIWHISREYGELAEAGGIKDVVTGLALSLARSGHPVTVVLPRYGFIDLESLGAEKLPIRIALRLPSQNHASAMALEEVEVHTLSREGVRLFLLDSARSRAKRAVYTYTEEDERAHPAQLRGSGHWDAHHLNLTLQRGALELAHALREKPSVFHCHDGHCAFLPAIMREVHPFKEHFQRTRALITIHNAGTGYHQEIHDPEFARQLTGLPAAVLSRGMLNGAVDPLLLGGFYAGLNTVSEGYAHEIMAGDLNGLTGGLGSAYREQGLLLEGITNGIDPLPFDPRFPEHSGLPFSFDPLSGELEGKGRCKEQLLESLSLPPARAFSALNGLKRIGFLQPAAKEPLYAFVGRLTSQKGVDLLVQTLSDLLAQGTRARFLILGEGEKRIEESLADLSGEQRSAGRLVLLIGYNTRISKLVFAAGDFFLLPSLYEPCGLTDFYAQMMGSLPIAHRVGGLAKVRDGFNGYSYAEHSASSLTKAILRSLSDFRRRPALLRKMRRQAVEEIYAHYTWDKVLSQHYLPLYRGEDGRAGA